MSHEIHFVLNSQSRRISVPPGLLVLDYLRQRERLVGTKEGCKEGDCGACVVLVGELHGDAVSYKPVTSCLMPAGELHGKHLVTIEGINGAGLTPVQQAIVDEGGSQCGFCTPGIVMSLTAYLMRPELPRDAAGIKYALGGNLCRCTGYASLKRAGAHLLEANGTRPATAKDAILRCVQKKILPDYFTEIPERLKKIPPAGKINGKARAQIIAGGTDLYVQKSDTLTHVTVNILNRMPNLKGIRIADGRIHVGALTTFEEFSRHPQIVKCIPEMPLYNLYNASWQIRNRATLGGNIINASPIGDMTALLLSLESELVLQNGNRKRTVPLKRFFKGYKQLDKKDAEILTEIIFPVPEQDERIHFEKVCKRKTLDIASVNSAIKIRSTNGTIESVHLSMGGVAPVPLYLQKTVDFLVGQPLNPETVRQAIAVAMTEISPISDIRGSATYKRLLVRQLLLAHFSELFPKQLSVREFYEAH